MISDRALGTAVANGVLTTEQAEALRAIERNTPVSREGVDDEALRFIGGFSDIFVTIGIILFVGALAYLAQQAAGPALSYCAVIVSTCCSPKSSRADVGWPYRASFS